MRHWHRPLMLLTAAMGALAVVGVVGLIVDPRILTGRPIWAKPLKFAISIGVYAPALAWMISLVQGDRARRWASVLGSVVAITFAIEMVAIVGQVVRGRTSHFDVATPLDAAVWSVMAGSIAVLFLAVIAMGVLLLLQRRLPTDTAWAIRLGVIVSLVGMVPAIIMSQPTSAQLTTARATGAMPTSGAHSVGVPDGGPGLPFVGWSTVGGDLRVAHFVGLHAMQGLPLLLVALTALAASVPPLADRRTRARLIIVAGAGWTGLVALLTWQALRAQPLVAPDALTLAVLGALVLVTVVAVVAVLRLGRTGAGAPTATDPTRDTVVT